MHSLGQTALHDCSGLPLHSSHFAESIWWWASPSLIAWLVHSGSHAPQLIQSSVILFAIERSFSEVGRSRILVHSDHLAGGTF